MIKRTLKLPVIKPIFSKISLKEEQEFSEQFEVIDAH